MNLQVEINLCVKDVSFINIFNYYFKTKYDQKKRTIYNWKWWALKNDN